ncbi:hypothetical protein PV02_00255 [Methanolobus chelungpuianus]|uniref:Uncharacterized protein n=2 Tax=Methanolobus chelungpuianus TaxID=502115 RepID=A0AAE3H8K3_9EURY|nr:hypothetical protein [Methanolobus chelungpuianus]
MMTRITTTKVDMPMCTSMDILHMRNKREPADQDVLPFIAVHGNHATINNEAVLYEEEEVYQVYTKNVFIQIEKPTPEKTIEPKTEVEPDLGIYH